jgi:uncharacterized membrane protein
MIALAGILVVALVAMLALAVDFGRLGNLKADLQTSADAAVLAGAVEFIPLAGHNAAVALDSARAYVLRNPAMGAVVTVVSAECGTWNDAGPVFLSSGATCTAGVSNSIRVTVSRQSSGLFMAALGVPAPILRATATVAMRPDLPNPYSCSNPNCRLYLVPNQ